MNSPAQKLMPAPGPTAAAKPAASAGPIVKRLKKGETLFSEGENSRAMYLVKTGMIRIFKKKGDAAIELDTIRAGQILGELAFLDGNPRSASGEALTDCELLEISGPTFQSTLASMPDWLKIMLKTVVGRLRSASTRIRQLETASTHFDYKDKTGKRESSYIYLPSHEILRTCSAVLLAVNKGPQPAAESRLSLRPALINRYASQIMQVPTAKVTSVLDVLNMCGVIEIRGEGEEMDLLQPEFLEKFIGYVNDENFLEPSKRHDISPRGFFVMASLAKHIKSFPENSEGISEINVAQVRKIESEKAGKDVFRLDEVGELGKLGYCTNINLKSASEAFIQVKTKAFMQAYRYQRILIEIRTLNEQKR
jgi:CRP-like cAMP-binding protein